MNAIIEHWQNELATDFTRGALKISIILWALFIIALALMVDDKYALAAIFMYETLP